MLGKKFGFYGCSLLLTLTLAACSKIPENTDIYTAHNEITIVGDVDSEKEDLPEITAGTEIGEIIPDKITDKLPDIEIKTNTSEQEIRTETTGTPAELTVQYSETEISLVLPENSQTADGIENTDNPDITDNTDNVSGSGNSRTDSSSAQTSASDEPVASEKTAAAPITTVPAETEPQVVTTEATETPQTELTETEPAVTAPSLTGGAYDQRFCTESEKEFADKVFELTNVERQKNGLPEFERMDVLKNVALTRAWELTVEYRGDHSRPDGSICTGAFAENGIIYGGWAENIAAGQDTPEGVVEAWMNSPSHRAAILNEDYTYLGVGYYYIEDDYQSYYHFWTQEFYHY